MMVTEKDCIQHQVVFEAQSTKCPEPVRQAVQEFWKAHTIVNNRCPWISTNMGKDYPIIDNYLKSRGVNYY